jgi:superfamily II DNA or RNA helicase
MSRGLLKALLRTKSAAIKPDVTPQEHQERVRQRLQADIPGLLVYHGLGSGKTFTSHLVGEDVPGPKEVITPASLRSNYQQSLEQYVTKPRDYHVRSYNAAAGTQGQPRTGLTIFDEAHRMGRPESDLSDLVERTHGKKLLLTGSPIRNEPSELVPLLKAIAPDRDIPRSAEDFDKKFVTRETIEPGFFGKLLGRQPQTLDRLKNQHQLRKLLQGRVDYQPSVGDFPDVHEQEVNVDMTQPQTDMYRALVDSDTELSYKIRRNLPPNKRELLNLNSFLSATRQVSNHPRAYDERLKQLPGDDVDHSPKLARMAEEISLKHKDDPDFRGLVYSNYIDSGVIPLAKRLTSMGISNAIFTGDLNDRERQHIVNNYNAGKLRVLLISGAGAEGLNLKGTRLVQLMEPHWNTPRLDQVIGRASRMGSHAHLPKEKQNVLVQRFFAVPRKTALEHLGLGTPDLGTDRYLHNMAQQKHKLVNQLLDIMKEVGSDTDRPTV